MVKAGEKATRSSRHSWSRETFSVFAVVAAVAAVTFGLSSAQAHTTTATLFPDGQGFYTAWTNGESAIDETGTPDCSSSESVIEATGNDRESVLISLASVPDGATITNVDVQVWHRGDSAAGGTFQTFARLNGTDTDSGTDIAAVGTSGCSGPVTQTINVADTVKGGGTALEVGVVKTAANGATVRVGAIRATVTYNRGPSAPTLSSPADASSTDDQTPTFDWSEDSVDPDDPGGTATLLPNGQGFYTAWTGDEGDIDESGTPSCEQTDSVIESTGNDRESVLISLATVPDGATITNVDVQVWHRGDSAAGGTFQAFARLNGTNTDSGTDIVAVGNSGGCSGPVTQSINVADTVKAGGTALEVGVLKTATNSTTVRVGAIRAVVHYTPSSEEPFTYDISRAAFVSGACDWGNATTNNVASSQFTPSSDMSLGVHCWRVRALDHAGLAGPWSAHRTLTIEPKDVTAEITAANKVYDGSADADYTCQVVGVDVGDDVDCDGDHPASFDTSDVGTGQTVTATGLELSGPDSGDYNLTNDSDTDLADITKADPDCQVDGYSGAYDGDSHGASGSCAGVNDEGPLAGLDLGNSFTNVPGGTADWAFTDQSGNYSDDDGSVEIEITKAEPDCTVTGYSGAYDGDSHGASGSCAGVNDEGPLAGLDLGNSFTNVPGGTADWAFTDQSGNYSDDDGSVEIEITKAEPDCTVTGYSGAYDGDSHGASGSCAGVNDEGPLAGLDLGNSFTNVPGGTADWAFTDQSGNYSDDDGSVEIEITKADPDCTVTGYSGAYDGDSHGASGSCAGVNDEGPLAGLDLGNSFTNVPGGTADWAFTDQSGNYSDDDGSVEIEITKADPDCTVTGYSGAYDGDSHGASGSCAGVNDEGPLAGLDLGNSFTNVPGGTADWAFTDQSGNYSDDDGSVEIEITKAEPDCTVTGYSGAYDGDSHGASGSCAGVNDEGPLAGLDLGNSFTNVPGGTADWAFTDQSGNYSDDDGSVEIEITKVTLSIDADDKSKDYSAPDPPFTYKLSGFVNGEDKHSAGVTGEAECTREAGQSVAGSPYEITCTAGTLDADNYGFETGVVGELTIIEADALVRYIGETVFVSSGSSSTTAKVTLTASLQQAQGLTLGTATVNFVDANTGKVLAANVPVQPVAGQPNVGTANTSITLSTGQFGAESYLIRVVATGNYTNADQDDADKTATVVAMKPTTINSTIGGGTIDPLVPRGTYAGDLDEDATFSIGMQYTSKGTNLKGKITLYVPQTDGSIIVVKSNSISSMKVAGTTTKTSTIYTKASLSRLDGGVLTAITGSVTLRVDVLEPSTGPANSEVGFTVLSSSNSKLFYSNRWVLENNTWKTKTQTLESGAVDIN